MVLHCTLHFFGITAICFAPTAAVVYQIYHFYLFLHPLLTSWHNPSRNHNLNISTERQIKTPAPFWLHSQLPVNVPFENNLFSGMRITCFGNKSSAQAAENETSPYLYPSTFSQRICAIHKNGPWGFRIYGFP